MTIITYLKFKDSVEAFFGRELFKKGIIVWAGHQVVQFIGIEEEDWDEVIIVVGMDDSALKTVEEESKIENFKIIQLKMISRENLAKMNAFLKASLKLKIDKTPGKGYLEEHAQGGRNDPTIEQAKQVLERDMDKPMGVINMVTYRDRVMYPKDYDGKKGKDSRKAYQLYGTNIQRVLGNYGVQIKGLGLVKTVLAGKEDSDWHDFTFFQYPAPQDLIDSYGLKVADKYLVHREAGLLKSKIFLATPYEEFY
jgi:hypothetical protein